MSISCSSTKKITSLVNSNDSPIPVYPSQFSLPISVSREELNSLVYRLYQNSFAEGFQLESGYICNVNLKEVPDFEASGATIKSIIPLQVNIIAHKSLQQLQANGIIRLYIDSHFEIQDNKFYSKSIISKYEWITPPKLNVLGFQLPIQTLANQIIKYAENKMMASLDESIQNLIDIKKLGSLVQKYFSTPFYSTEDSILNVYIKPLEIALGSMSTTEHSLLIPALFYAESTLDIQSNRNDDAEMSFSIRPHVDSISHIYIFNRIPLAYIEQSIRESVHQQVFGSGRTSFSIKNIKLSGNLKTLNAETELSGAFNGKLNLKFDPNFDSEKRKWDLLNFDMKIAEGRTIDKTLFFLVKSVLQSKVKNTIEDQLNTMVRDMSQSIEAELKLNEVSKGCFLSGQIENYQIQNFLIQDNKLQFILKAQLWAKLDVLDLPYLKVN